MAVSTRDSRVHRQLEKDLKKVAKKQSNSSRIHVVHADAAGIDAGSEEHFVAVPEDRCSDSVRSFGVYTIDLIGLGNWLKECGVKQVAIESTGIYWVPVLQILEFMGFEVTLVHAAYTQNVPGKKSDVEDCQWLRELHTYGLLPAAFRPCQEVCTLRTLWRHRARLVQDASTHIQRMQKALTEMNILVHHAVSDITGQTGMAIVRDIVAGVREPRELAKHRDRRCKKSEEEISKALTGDYNRTEQLFVLKQELAHYDFIQGQIRDLDQEFAKAFAGMEKKAAALQPAKRPRIRKVGSNSPQVDLATELCQVLGIDLLSVKGFQVSMLITLVTECGVDMSHWLTEKHFVSWLGLSPGCKKSGGKIQSARTRKVANRAATVFRLAAQSLEKADCYLGAFYRRLKARKGHPKATTATARKLAIIYYRALKDGEVYDEKGADCYDQKFKERTVKYLEKRASALGYQLVLVDPDKADVPELEKKARAVKIVLDASAANAAP